MENNGACCWAETNVVKRAATALEKMKEMFVLALSNLEDPSCEPTKVASGNVTDSDRHREACTFRGNPVASNDVLRMFCASRPKPDGRRPDRDVVRLLPGEVGLRGDRATFHLGRHADQPVPVAEDGRPTGPVYYHDTRPTVAASSPWPGKSGAAQQRPAAAAAAAHSQQQQCKRVMRVLPSLPASAANPVVGPVTGLPVDDSENVFALQLSKRYGEQDEKACLQIEVRLPRQQGKERADTDTQCLETDLPVADVGPETKKKRTDKKKRINMKKKKRGVKKFGAKKGKK